MKGALLVFAVALMTALTTGSTAASRSQTSYANAAIADKALSYVGQWGGNACRNAHRSGLTGSATVYPVKASKVRSDGTIDPNFGGDGQCRAFVNCIVWMVSSHTQWLGGTYFGSFLQAGAKEITNVDQLAKGDIVQSGDGVHTFIIVRRVKGNVFNVVDSNHDYKETVLAYNRAVKLGVGNRAFRMSAASSNASPGTTAKVPNIVFDRGKFIPAGAEMHEVWQIAPTGAGLKRIFKIPVGALDNARLSSNGKLITFTGGDGPHLWVMNRDGSNAHPIGAAPGLVGFSPSLSPDNRHVVYQRVDPKVTGLTTLVANVDGTQSHIIHIGEDKNWIIWSGTNELIFDDSLPLGLTASSPDMNRQRVIVASDRLSGYRPYQPDSSPDGSQIVFATERCSSCPLYVVNSNRPG